MKKSLPYDTTSLVSIACGNSPADIYLANGRVVNVLTGEILCGRGVAIGGNRIAYVGPETNMIGGETKVIDCKDSYIVPGYVDSHCHADYFYNPFAFTRHALATGTTTVLTELTEICGSAGPRGLDYMLSATEKLSLKFYFSLPSSIPTFPEIEGYDYFPLSDMERYVENRRILTLGEITSWPRITAMHRNIIDKINSAISNGLLIEGHLTGCKNHEINALAASGITSCHESITSGEAKEKLELGLYVMLRHGSIRSDMEELSHLVIDNPNINTSRIILILDWLSPEDMVLHGYMNYLVKCAIGVGVDPVTAIQMVTINPATYLGLGREIGSISPGKIADILIVKELEQGLPEMVIANGKMVASSGRLCDEIVIPDISYHGPSPVNWPDKKFTAHDFRINILRKTGSFAIFPVIKVVNKTITKRMDKQFEIQNGSIIPDQKDGIIKVSVIRADGNVTSGLLHGFGGKIGGLATSIGVCTNKLVILGNDDIDMAVATNRMLELNGGVVLVKKGNVISELPFAIAGIQSNEDVNTLAGQMKQMKKAIKEMGCLLEDPLFTIHFLTMSGLPFIRILQNGIFDVVSKKVIFESEFIR